MNNTNTLSPDDPKLTAYALGELDGAERAAVEAAVRADPALQAAVAELRVFATDLSGALAQEPAQAPATPSAKAETYPALHDRIEAPAMERECHLLGDKTSGRAGQDRAVATEEPTRSFDPYRRKVVRLPFYYVVSGLAAAGFAVVVWIHDRGYAAKDAPRVQVFEVNLAPTPQAAPLAESAAVTPPSLVKPAATGETVASAAPVLVATPPRPEPAGTTPRTAPLLDQVKKEQASARGAAVPSVAFAPPLESKVLGTAVAATRKDTDADASWSVGGKSEVTTPEFTRPATAPDSETIQLSSFAVQSEATFRVKEAVTGSGSARIAGVAAAGQPLPPGVRRSVVNPGEPTPQFPPALPSHLVPNTEAYAFAHDNLFLGAAENPLSTFSIDVDTASYANVRRFLRSGGLPPRDAVRIEELVNYFPYRYAAPTGPGATDEDGGAAPFAAHLEVASAPWAPEHRLVRIGLKGHEIANAARPAANLVFLLDVSGSMSSPNKLPLVKESMRLLLGKLRADDRVAIVTYAGASGLALPSTPVRQKAEILSSVDMLRPGGSTNGAMGIQLAYDVAKANFVAGGLNRVILCTDGDFNVGVTSQGELVRLIEEKAKSGVFLTVLGYGMGNYKDSTLEQLADKGNGAYGYIDTEREARKLLVEQVEGTLSTIAKDVKVQVEFNPEKVAAYRLIGYENRLLKKEDFNDDAVDAGEIGAGHTVTALYEIVPAGREWSPAGSVDELKYQPVETPKSAVRTPQSSELLTVKIRYKTPEGDTSRKLEFPLTDRGADFAAATADFKFAAAVAGFGLVLRESPHKGAATLARVIDWAEDGLAEDPEGYRAEFIELVRLAQGLAGE